MLARHPAVASVLEREGKDELAVKGLAARWLLRQAHVAEEVPEAVSRGLYASAEDVEAVKRWWKKHKHQYPPPVWPATGIRPVSDEKAPLTLDRGNEAR